ncbi:MAG: ATP-binding protein [Pseudomonadota bacterium]|uniref:hypothetical protein n=1 Tax=Thermithiobacillus tepidarius TaxID=929 RepID=UPI000416C7D8|nr:hypothetical protein [Thermithiobacillus tepidarius]
MNIPLADIMLHVDELLGREELERLEDMLRADDGIISAHFPAARPHLMLVAYNPDCITSGEILGRIVQSGRHAELIGL